MVCIYNNHKLTMSPSYSVMPFAFLIPNPFFIQSSCLFSHHDHPPQNQSVFSCFPSRKLGSFQQKPSKPCTKPWYSSLRPSKSSSRVSRSMPSWHPSSLAASFIHSSSLPNHNNKISWSPPSSSPSSLFIPRSGTTPQPPPLTELGVSFSPAGLLFPYHVGVMYVLQSHQILSRATPVAGASGGALTAAIAGIGIDPQQAVQASIDLSLRCAEMGGTRGNLQVALREQLEKILPDNAHIVINDRPAKVTIAITRLIHKTHLLPRGLFVDRFESRQALIEALIASCCIPFYFSKWPVVIYQGWPAVDGFFASDRRKFGAPKTGARYDITVCPFPATSVGMSFDELTLSPHVSSWGSCVMPSAMDRPLTSPFSTPGASSYPPGSNNPKERGVVLSQGTSSSSSSSSSSSPVSGVVPGSTKTFSKAGIATWGATSYPQEQEQQEQQEQRRRINPQQMELMGTVTQGSIKLEPRCEEQVMVTTGQRLQLALGIPPPEADQIWNLYKEGLRDAETWLMMRSLYSASL